VKSTITDTGSVALRELAASGSSERTVEITMRVSDFDIVSLTDPASGQPSPFPAQSLVMFVAQRFREVGEMSGVWEFRVKSDTPTGEPATALVYLAGADILSVKTMSMLA